MSERSTPSPSEIKTPPTHNAMVAAIARHTNEATAERAKRKSAMLMRAQQHWKASKYIADKTRLICAGLVGIGIIILGSFVQIGVFTTSTGPPPSKELDIPAFISVIAFAVALPLLSVRLLASFEVASRRIIVGDTLGLRIAYWFGTFLALVGIATAFWHISPVPGIFVSASMIIGFIFYTGYGRSLDRLDTQMKHGRVGNMRSEESLPSTEEIN